MEGRKNLALLLLLCFILQADGLKLFPLSRVKRATWESFQDNHVMSPAEATRMTRDPSLTALRFENRQNAGNNAHRQAAREHSPNFYPRDRTRQSYIVANTNDVRNAFAPNARIPVTNGNNNRNNLFQSNQPFPVINVERNNRGQGISRISTHTAPITTGVVNNLPAHFEGSGRPQGQRILYQAPQPAQANIRPLQPQNRQPAQSNNQRVFTGNTGPPTRGGTNTFSASTRGGANTFAASTSAGTSTNSQNRHGSGFANRGSGSGSSSAKGASSSRGGHTSSASRGAGSSTNIRRG